MNNYKFELDISQALLFETWKEDQMKKDPTLPLAGERFSFRFTPTGLGTVVVAIDEHLGEEIDLTDYETF